MGLADARPARTIAAESAGQILDGNFPASRARNEADGTNQFMPPFWPSVYGANKVGSCVIGMRICLIYPELHLARVGRSDGVAAPRRLPGFHHLPDARMDSEAS